MCCGDINISMVIIRGVEIVNTWKHINLEERDDVVIQALLTLVRNFELPEEELQYLEVTIKTTINIPFIGRHNIEYERTKYLVSEIRLNGKINCIGNVYLKNLDNDQYYLLLHHKKLVDYLYLNS